MKKLENVDLKKDVQKFLIGRGQKKMFLKNCLKQQLHLPLLPASYKYKDVLLWRLIPESPSWLLVVGQVDRALTQLKTTARINKKDNQVRVSRNMLQWS
jgi:hypothetical protein